MKFNGVHCYGRLIIIFLWLYSSLSVAQYKNSDTSIGLKSLPDVIKWRLNAPASPERVAIELSDEWKKNDFAENNYAVWIGHATFLIKNNDITVLTDPIFSNRASPVGFLGPKRLIPPAISIKDLPKIDVIVISHNHYDHLDINSLRKIQKRFPNVKILVPKGDLKLLKNYQIINGYEFIWWEDKIISNTKFTFTPAQHWSARGLRDRNKSLWGSWFIKNDNKNIFHAGDTGYSKDFVEIKNKLGPVDFAMIPIGAYDPEWFMSYSHVTPEEALNISIDLEAKKSIGMHWGTFILTDEPVLEPRERLKKIVSETNINFYTVEPGIMIELY